MSEQFKIKLEELKIELSEVQYKQFDQFYELLTEWNKVMNLTSITEYEEVNEKHFVDSLAIVKTLNMADVKSVIDIGTGAGFPGIPLKIAYPHLEIVLLDSLQKRIKFLDTVIDSLGLKNIRTIHGRAEDFAQQKVYREQFDLCVSRAVANLATLSEYCVPYVRIGGAFVAYKSGDIEAELEQSQKAVSILGGKLAPTVKFELPGSEIKRSFVTINKEKKTGRNYPRKAGLPAKEPLA